MLSDGQKLWLEDLFFQDSTQPDGLNEEEKEYWGRLSRQWDQALLHMLEKISQQDDLHHKA